jgi:two-component system cell cycle sensor histidine kinase/response regulator CckA
MLMAGLFGLHTYDPRLRRGGAGTTPQEAIVALLTHDADVAYLTDLDGYIMYASPVTVERFGDISDGHLATAFSRLLVNPEAVLCRL